MLWTLECPEWFAAPLSARLRRGSRGCYRSECTGGEPMAAPRVKLFLATHKDGQAASIVFRLQPDLTGVESSLPALVARV